MPKTCIYCKQQFEKAPPEHIFLEAFGCPNSYVLDCVCDPCNNLFGGTIDRFLASDSYEGFIRRTTLGSQSADILENRRIRLIANINGRCILIKIIGKKPGKVELNTQVTVKNDRLNNSI